MEEIVTDLNSDRMVPLIRSLHTSNLKYLTICGCPPTENNFLEELSNKNFPVLERLYLDRGQYSKHSIKSFLKNSPSIKSVQLYMGKLNRDIDDTFLYDMCTETGVYIDFAGSNNLKRNHTRGWNHVGQFCMERYLSKTIKWTKYKNLFNDFHQWCKENDWWRDGPLPMPHCIYDPKNSILGYEICSTQRKRMIKVEEGKSLTHDEYIG